MQKRYVIQLCVLHLRLHFVCLLDKVFYFKIIQVFLTSVMDTNFSRPLTNNQASFHIVLLRPDLPRSYLLIIKTERSTTNSFLSLFLPISPLSVPAVYISSNPRDYIRWLTLSQVAICVNMRTKLLKMFLFFFSYRKKKKGLKTQKFHHKVVNLPVLRLSYVLS